jgi:hypothetical protein
MRFCVNFLFCLRDLRVVLRHSQATARSTGLAGFVVRASPCCLTSIRPSKTTTSFRARLRLAERCKRTRAAPGGRRAFEVWPSDVNALEPLPEGIALNSTSRAAVRTGALASQRVGRVPWDVPTPKDPFLRLPPAFLRFLFNPPPLRWVARVYALASASRSDLSPPPAFSGPSSPPKRST